MASLAWLSLVFESLTVLLVLLDDEDEAGTVVLAYIFDGRGLPLLADGGLVNSALDFVVVFEIGLSLSNTGKQLFLAD